MYPEDFEEQLDLTHGYDHIKSVTSLVHKAVENLTKDNRVGTRPDGMSFYVLSDKRSADPEKMKKLILDTLAAEGYEPDEVQFVDKGQVYGYVIGSIKMMARMTMSYQKKESLTEKFTPEEMEDYNMDEDGNSLDGYDTYVKCSWCDEIFTESECEFEYHMGWLCDRCQNAITSRGEKLMIITNPTEEDKARTLTEDVELDESAILAGVATGVIVDVVKRIMDKFGKGKKKSKWIDFRKYVIEKTPEGQINIWNHDSEQVASDLKTVAAAKEKIKELNLKAKKPEAEKVEIATESLIEEAEDEIEPISVDPEEKPSKNVKMANTAGTSGMDFETACQMFGIELQN